MGFLHNRDSDDAAIAAVVDDDPANKREMNVKSQIAFPALKSCRPRRGNDDLHDKGNKLTSKVAGKVSLVPVWVSSLCPL